MEPRWLHIDYFTDVIQEHDAFAASGTFDEWRATFSKHAHSLADYFFTAFASVRDGLPDKAALIDSFQSVSREDFEKEYRALGSRAFNPWTNWFHGYWDNGTNRTENFHIWDFTSPIAGRYMQLVTQSRTDFAYSKDKSGKKVTVQKDMMDRGKTDLGVDFSSSDYGLTGWVTKLQEKPVLHMPHVGYLVEDKRLIWIAQYVGEDPNEWYLFYERGNRQLRASIYDVDGVRFSINASAGAGPPKTQNKGRVTYYCQIPYSQECVVTSACDE